MNRAIVIWDKVGGGLGLSKAVADNLGRYTQALLEIVRQPGQRSEQERLLREDTAAALHRWATSMAPHTLGPEHTPAITEYAGTTFRSQLEARWAAYFDQPRDCLAVRAGPAQRLDSRLPARTQRRRSLRRGQARERVPLDVAQRVLGAGWTGDILILGREPRHAWRYQGDGWNPVDLAA